MNRILRRIDKVETTAEGYRRISAIATGPEVDRDKQRCDPDWLKTAVPGWMENSGAVREMHGKVAAGKGLGVEPDGTEWRVSALIVDPGSIAKVDTGVLSMMSIGIADGKVKPDPTGKAVNGIICGGEIPEISLVDLGAYKGATIDEVEVIAKLAKDFAGVPSDPYASLRALMGKVALAVTSPTEAVAFLTSRGITKAEDAEMLHDPDTLAEVRQGLIDSIKAELDEWASGEPEGCDVQMLVDALRTFLCWWQSEAWEGETLAPADTDAPEDDEDAAPDKAARSAAATNDLPDTAFAYIEPGGTKDASGKTIPRSKRHFPIDDAAHVRNALARVASSPFGDEALPKIKAAAKKFGVEIADDKSAEADMAQLLGALGITEATIDKAASVDATDDDKTALAAEIHKALGIDKVLAAIEKIDEKVGDVQEGESLAARLSNVEAMAAPPLGSKVGKADTRVQEAEKVAEIDQRITSLRNSADVAQPNDKIAFGELIAKLEIERATLTNA